MAYRASIGGAFGGGAGPATAHPIDVGQLVDAFTSGASTLIAQRYAQKRAAQELELNQQKANQEAQRYADQNRINEQRYTDQNTRESARYESDRKQKKLEAGLKALGEGVQLPANYWDEYSPSERPGSAPVAASPTATPSNGGGTIADAFSRGDLSVSPTPAPVSQAPAPAIAQAYQGSAPTPAPVTVPTYSAAHDPRITRAAAITEANERAKLKLAPLMASADSAKAVNTARGLVPIHIGQAVATKAAELPMEIQADSIKESHKHLDADESTATAQLPDIAHGISILRTLPPQDARSALTARGGFWRNYLNSPQGQQFNQAAKQIALSGALAKEGPRGGQPDRVKMFQDTFVPGAGDSDAVAEQKYAQLQNLVKEVKLKSGRGYERLDPQTKSAIEAVVSGGHAPVPTGTAHPVAQKYGITPSTP